MIWELKISKITRKQIKKFPKTDGERIFFAIADLRQGDIFNGDVKKLKGEGYMWRRRVGNYRIFFEISKEEKMISIIAVKRRTSKTY